MTRAAAALGAARGRPVQLDLVENCVPWKGATNAVLRCVERATGTSVIVKRAHERGGPLITEWAALASLGEIRELADGVPRVLAWEAAHELLVVGDLGRPEAERLGVLLDGDDPARAESALVAHSTALAELHGRTSGRTRAFEERLAACGPLRASRHGVHLLEDHLGRVGERLRAAGVSVGPDLDEELRGVAARLRRRGPFHALTHGDATPANAYCADGRAWLFDFETAAVRHCLVDGSFAALRYLQSIWAGRIPDSVRDRTLAAYRQRLSTHLPAARDDDAWGRALLDGAATWLAVLWRMLPAALEQDHRWGRGTRRQRMAQGAADYLRVQASVGLDSALGDAAGRLLEGAVASWLPEQRVLRRHRAWSAD